MIRLGIMLVGLLSVFLADAADTDVCHQRDGDLCKCVYADGSGYDLSEIDKSKNVLETQGRDDNNLTFFYHPCHDMDIQHTENSTLFRCPSASLCVFNHTVNNFTSSLIAKDSMFSETDGQIFIVLKNPLVNGTVVMIQLGCTNLPVDRLVMVKDQNNDDIENETDKQQYNLVLYSTHACKQQLEVVKKMSTGTILVVSFFTIIMAYLILGMSFNHFLIGARGIEIVPNLTFWRDFPSLVQDGITFIQNGCNPVPTSELLTPSTPNPDSYGSIFVYL